MQYFKRIVLLLLALGWKLSAVWAQLTLLVTSIPANTPANDQIFVAGNFNNWNAGDPATILQPDGRGNRYYTIPAPVPATVEYKFTRGSWPTVEGAANGGFRPNRTASGTADTLRLQILGWEDQAGSTASPTVSVMKPSFYIPQLNRYRRIWIYLPPDYASSSKRYPVLYMHDGQNLFDNRFAFAGEWNVDGTLDALHSQGDWGCIVIGIDNGGQSRIDEYSPWQNGRLGGGEGDAYMRFIIHTLKPYVDSAFRTLPDREYTGLMGSSMGGLISYYGGLQYQDVFGKVGIFSPSFWFSPQTYSFADTMHRRAPMRIFMMGGQNEGGNMVRKMDSIYQRLRGRGFSEQELRQEVFADGAHSEWFWKREFGPAYQWLFAGVSLELQRHDGRQGLKVYPNPARDRVNVEAPGPATIELYDLNQRLLGSWRINGRDQLDLQHIPAGVYWLSLRKNKKPLFQRLIKL